MSADSCYSCIQKPGMTVPAPLQAQTFDGQSCEQAVGLETGSLNSYVLDNDPIPRALLSMDPTFDWLRRWGVVGRAVSAGSAWLGLPAPSPSPALLHNAGSIYLVKWSADAGHQVWLTLHAFTAAVHSSVPDGMIGHAAGLILRVSWHSVLSGLLLPAAGADAARCPCR